MPRQDAAGQGLCLNCHDPHGTENPRDILVALYGGISGHAGIGRHRRATASASPATAPTVRPGWITENRYIEDYYDSGLNGERRPATRSVATPTSPSPGRPHIQVGDKLPCYDCHNPHGSEGQQSGRSPTPS